MVKMNERIKEISKKAMDYSIEQYGPQRSGEQVWNPLTYEKKYAELIIEECIKAAQNTDFRSVTYTTFDRDRIAYCKEEIVKNIKKAMD